MINKDIEKARLGSQQVAASGEISGRERGWKVQMKKGLKGMSYATGLASVSPLVQKKQIQKKDDKPEIEATEEAMGGRMVELMNKANAGPHTLESGIHYSHNYERFCEWYGKKELWKDEYRMGHNASGHFTNPYEHGRFMEFRLKPGHSASEAIKAWHTGLTIAECNSAVVAMQIDTVRAAIGDERFDRMFGHTDAKLDKNIPDHQRLRVKPGISGTPAQLFVKQPELSKEHEKKKARGEEMKPEEYDALLKPGEWYYFYNHPKYLLKHPGGAWQGENSLYMGKNDAGERLWSGLGASNVSESRMFEHMADAYNMDRNKHDERAMKEYGVTGEDGKYKDKKYDPAGGEFPDKITVDDILKSTPYTLHGTTRKGGFLPEAGITLDPKKVSKAREKKIE